MNILYIIQHSVYTSNKKWTIADSNISMFSGIVHAIFKDSPENTDLHFFVLIAPLNDFDNLYSYDNLLISKDYSNKITFIPYNFPVDAFLNRQNFNIADFEKVLDSFSIDVVWNNIPEISRNIKTLLYFKNISAKLVTCNYWMDCPSIGEPKVPFEISYAWRQFDGALCSDLVVFTCESTKQAFFANAKQMFSKEFIDRIARKSTIWDFGFSSSEIDTFIQNSSSKPNPFLSSGDKAKKVIIFPNRLSGINYTHHEEFILAINDLATRRDDFIVAFTNPSKKYSKKFFLDNLDVKVIIPNDVLSREDYITWLLYANVGVSLFTIERYGGCSSRELLATNNILIAPGIFEYRRILGYSYEGFVKYSKLTKNISVSSLSDKLNWALDHIDSNFDFEIYNRNLRSSFEISVVHVMRDLALLEVG